MVYHGDKVKFISAQLKDRYYIDRKVSIGKNSWRLCGWKRFLGGGGGACIIRDSSGLVRAWHGMIWHWKAKRVCGGGFLMICCALAMMIP